MTTDVSVWLDSITSANIFSLNWNTMKSSQINKSSVNYLLIKSFSVLYHFAAAIIEVSSSFCALKQSFIFIWRTDCYRLSVFV